MGTILVKNSLSDVTVIRDLGANSDFTIMSIYQG